VILTRGGHSGGGWVAGDVALAGCQSVVVVVGGGVGVTRKGVEHDCLMFNPTIFNINHY
jgi:hypothetical protein